MSIRKKLTERYAQMSVVDDLSGRKISGTCWRMREDYVSDMIGRGKYVDLNNGLFVMVLREVLKSRELLVARQNRPRLNWGGWPGQVPSE